MKKYGGITMEVIMLNENDVISTSNIVLPDVEIGSDVGAFE